MSFGSLVSESGLHDADINIDGTALAMPMKIDVHNPPTQALFQALNGRNIVTVPYRGDGLPDQPDGPCDWALDYELADNVPDLVIALAFLEGLRTAGGIHTFTYWKQYRYKYTLRAGQTVLYLPRPDSFSKGYSGKTDARYKAVITVTPSGGAATTPTVGYVASVTSGTAVAAGNVSISNTATVHPDSGASVALFKLGDSPAANTVVRVDYIPLFNVAITGVPTKPFDRVGREDKVLYLTEVN